MLDQIRKLKAKMAEDTELNAELEMRQQATIKAIEAEARARDKRRQAMARLFPAVPPLWPAAESTGTQT
jgi:hypothetical protein